MATESNQAPDMTQEKRRFKLFSRMFIAGIILLLVAVGGAVMFHLPWYIFVPMLIAGIAMMPIGFIYGFKAQNRLQKNEVEQLQKIVPEILARYTTVEWFHPDSFVIAQQANDYSRKGSCLIRGKTGDMKYAVSNLHLAEPWKDTTRTTFSGWCLCIGDGRPVTEARLSALQDALLDYAPVRIVARSDAENEILALLEQPALFLDPAPTEDKTRQQLEADCKNVCFMLDCCAEAMRQTATE